MPSAKAGIKKGEKAIATSRENAVSEFFANVGCFHIRDEIHHPSSGMDDMTELVLDVGTLKEGLARLSTLDATLSVRHWLVVLELMQHEDWVAVGFDPSWWKSTPASTASRIIASLAGYQTTNARPREAWIEIKDDPEDRRKALARLLGHRREALAEALKGQREGLAPDD